MSNKRGRKRRQAQGTSPPRQPVSEVTLKPHSEQSLAPVTENLEHERSAERQRDDDQAIVNLTRWLVRWTAALVLVGILTAGVGLIQWSALLRTDNTTREAFTAVQRPFITAVGLDISQEAAIYWRLRTILENTGSTPTKNMTVVSSVSFAVPVVPDTPSDPSELKKQTDDAYPTITDHFVGPHGKLGIDAISLATKTLEGMADARADFYVSGVARYSDQFSETNERLTKFCFVVRPFKGPNGLTLNNYGLCHHWNCGDGDCDRDKRNYELDRKEILVRNPKAAEVNKEVPIGAIIPFFPIPLIKAQ